MARLARDAPSVWKPRDMLHFLTLVSEQVRSAVMNYIPDDLEQTF